MNIESIVPILGVIYQTKGRDGLVRALTIPGKTTERIAARNHDQASELREKNTAAAEALADLVAEILNLDND